MALKMAEIPTDTVEATDVAEPVTSDFTCIGCGKPLHYSGRGRPPTKCDDCKGTRKTTDGARRASTPKGEAAVTQAVQSLETLYTTLAALMMPFVPYTARELASKIPMLNQQNAGFLAHDPEMVKILNRGSAATGRVGFLATNLAVFVPLGIGAASELRARATPKDAE